MDSKRRYKTCIWFGRPRATWVFSKLQGLRYYFPENFRCNFKFYRNENFSDSSLHRIFESDNFRFPFSTKNRLTWGLKCEIKLIRKSYREFIRYATKIVRKWNGHLEIFNPPQAIENYRNRYFTEHSRWVPQPRHTLTKTSSQRGLINRSNSKAD